MSKYVFNFISIESLTIFDNFYKKLPFLRYTMILNYSKCFIQDIFGDNNNISQFVKVWIQLQFFVKPTFAENIIFC